MHLLAGILEHVYCIGMQMAWGWLQQPGRHMLKTISQPCSENSWGTFFLTSKGLSLACLMYLNVFGAFVDALACWNTWACLLHWHADGVRVVGCNSRDGTWLKPFHRPVPRTLEEPSFITSKGLSLACLMCLNVFGAFVDALPCWNTWAYSPCWHTDGVRVVATAGTAHDENHFTDLFRELLRNLLS